MLLLLVLLPHPGMIGHIIYNCQTKPPKLGQSGILPRPVTHSVAAAAEKSPSAPSLSSISVNYVNLVMTCGLVLLVVMCRILGRISIPVQEHLSKMVGLNVNTATYLTLLGLSLFLPHAERFLGKSPSPLFTPSTVFHPQFSKMCLPLNVSMASDLSLAASPVDSPVSPQDPAPPMDSVTDQTPLLPLCRSDWGMILLLLYVNDMIITGDDHSGISDFKQFLHQQFEMKDLGHLSYFLGFEIFSDSTGYYLSQAKYASDLLSCAGLTDTKVVSTHLEMNARLTPLDGTPPNDVILYRQLIGNLVYFIVTRLDIAHTVHLMSHFLVAPHSTYYVAVIHILRYINEYRALADTIFELLALHWLLEDMGFTHFSPTVIYCDNHSAIQIVHNDVFHERTKHIEIDCHLVHHHLFAGILRLLPVTSSDQTADIFTKTFLPCFRDLVSKLKMASVRPP
uniref:Reverse transcriptase Ty1/copia-type domain-containing protein n=1 Tax=Fagus sylvatica TaxID=28930 RepID=A0A2N9GB49_FAGSY